MQQVIASAVSRDRHADASESQTSRRMGQLISRFPTSAERPLKALLTELRYHVSHLKRTPHE
jgi:hypothetical protein